MTNLSHVIYTNYDKKQMIGYGLTYPIQITVYWQANKLVFVAIFLSNQGNVKLAVALNVYIIINAYTIYIEIQ